MGVREGRGKGWRGGTASKRARRKLQKERKRLREKLRKALEEVRKTGQVNTRAGIDCVRVCVAQQAFLPPCEEGEEEEGVGRLGELVSGWVVWCSPSPSHHHSISSVCLSISLPLSLRIYL